MIPGLPEHNHAVVQVSPAATAAAGPPILDKIAGDFGWGRQTYPAAHPQGFNQCATDGHAKATYGQGDVWGRVAGGAP